MSTLIKVLKEMYLEISNWRGSSKIVIFWKELRTKEQKQKSRSRKSSSNNSNKNRNCDGTSNSMKCKTRKILMIFVAKLGCQIKRKYPKGNRTDQRQKSKGPIANICKQMTYGKDKKSRRKITDSWQQRSNKSK